VQVATGLPVASSRALVGMASRTAKTVSTP